MEPIEFSLGVLAPNGLKRGRTTGSCATAAVKAALHLLLANQQLAQTKVMLPDGTHYLIVPIQACSWIDANTTRAEVLKDGGDDPDSTHGSTIYAEVRRNATQALCFKAGKGVGIATQPGLRVAVGEPAINPVPRLMMRQAVEEVLIETGNVNGLGFDLIIGCEQGEEIAKKTFNPRLGILGGISILGTSGIVEPLSLATWIASIEVYVRVALGGGAKSVAYLPGKIGRQFAKDVLGLSSQRAIQIANFLGEALDFTQQALAENNSRLEVLWLAGHPGKLAKVLDGIWDTHSSKSNMAMNAVANVASELAFEPAIVQEMRQANTVEAVMERLKNEPRAQAFWMEIESRISQLAHSRVPLVDRVEVRLFNLNGDALGKDYMIQENKVQKAI
jgi:cobalt-precorrin-5B (C1)-methyltransferase